MEAARVRMIGRDEAMVGVLQIWLQSYDGLLGNILDLLHEIAHILSLAHQVLDDRREKLL